MVATKRHGMLTLLPLAAGLILLFQNCAVEVSEETPGASSACEPTGTELDDFTNAMTNFLQRTGTLPSSSKEYCGACHLTTSGNIASARFGIVAGTDTKTKTRNWCAASAEVDRLKSGYLNGSHPGGVYTDAEVQAVIDWANTIVE